LGQFVKLGFAQNPAHARDAWVMSSGDGAAAFWRVLHHRAELQYLEGASITSDAPMREEHASWRVELYSKRNQPHQRRKHK
jgi:hypothetical protein